MLSITERAKEKLRELIKESREAFPESFHGYFRESGYFAFGYSEDKYDNKRGSEGENKFFVAEPAHWYLYVMPELVQSEKSVHDFGNLLGVVDPELEASLDYDGVKFLSNGQPVVVHT